MKRFYAAISICFGLFAWAFVTQANARTVEIQLETRLDSGTFLAVANIECGTYATGGCAVSASDFNAAKLIYIIACDSETGKYDVNVDRPNSKFQLWTDEDTELTNATDLTDEVVNCSAIVSEKRA